MTTLDPRLQELLADRALDAIDAPDFTELSTKRDQYSASDEASFEAAVGALAVAFESDLEPLPETLHAKLLNIATEQAASPPAPNAELAAAEPAIAGRIPAASSSERTTTGPIGIVGWVAAAMLFVVAIVGWRDNFAPAPADAQPIDLAAVRQELIDNGATPLNWGAWTEESETPEASGDVVWSDASDSGVMRLVGLPANTPDRPAYQLWIVDEEMGFDRRVSGGVFTVEPGQTEVLVAVDPAHPIDKATIFAITIEDEGGVGVSTMERKALVAAAQG